MICPAEGGYITAKATFWEAWGTQTITNLGHVSNFAFGYLVGRGCSEWYSSQELLLQKLLP